MINLFLVIPFIVSFLVTLFFLPTWIVRAKRAGLIGKDIHKLKSGDVAEGGGVTVLAGIVLGVLVYIAFITFELNSGQYVIPLLALLCSLLITGFIGIIDDILGWKIGLSKKIRIFLVIFAAIPLIAINAGNSTVSLPFLYQTDIGLLYTLLIIPLAIVATSTTFNFLAGYNGLEARQGVLLLGALAIATYFTGNSWLTIALLCAVASLTAFLFFNSNPATVFPGDVLTYSIGSLVGISAILGNLEWFVVFIFIPNILEVFLKLRGKLMKESFAAVQQDGSLLLRYPKVYGLEHLALLILLKVKKKAYESEVVMLINMFQLVIIVLGFLIFRSSIFV